MSAGASRGRSLVERIQVQRLGLGVWRIELMWAGVGRGILEHGLLDVVVGKGSASQWLSCVVSGRFLGGGVFIPFYLPMFCTFRSLGSGSFNGCFYSFSVFVAFDSNILAAPSPIPGL